MYDYYIPKLKVRLEIILWDKKISIMWINLVICLKAKKIIKYSTSNFLNNVRLNSLHTCHNKSNYPQILDSFSLAMCFLEHTLFVRILEFWLQKSLPIFIFGLWNLGKLHVEFCRGEKKWFNFKSLIFSKFQLN
jgi:hypothetical protein